MEVKFDVVKPNLLVCGNEIYSCIPREDVIKYARDVDEVIGKNIGILHVSEGDVGVMLDNAQRGKSRESVPLGEYLSACEQKPQDRFRGLTNGSSQLLGAGNYIVNAWTLEKSKDVNYEEIDGTKGFLRHISDKLKCIKEIIGTEIDETSARKHLEERLAKLEEGLAERFAHLWVILGLSPSEYLKRFYDDRIVVGRVLLENRRNEGADETIAKTREELVEKLKGYKGDRLSFDVPNLMNQAFRVYLDGNNLIANYGDVLDNPYWRRRLIMLDA